MHGINLYMEKLSRLNIKKRAQLRSLNSLSANYLEFNFTNYRAYILETYILLGVH
jgi:hypothetical protein